MRNKSKDTALRAVPKDIHTVILLDCVMKNQSENVMLNKKTSLDGFQNKSLYISLGYIFIRLGEQ